MKLSPDQSSAKDAIMSWRSDRNSLMMTMGGYAGTGKTTTLASTANSLRGERIAYVCFTGKASLVLKTKLEDAGVDPSFCGTIHSLIYRPDRKVRGMMTWKLVDRLDYSMIVIDEASMISEDILRDLESFDIPILAVGDHGQLPPVSGTLNLMGDPKIKLEKIHRQAEGSPIIRLSMMARLEGIIPVGTYGPGVVKTRDHSVLERIKDPKSGIILCGTNKTRVAINSSLRRRHGHPVTGERVVCLKNDRENNIYNGMLGEIESIEEFKSGDCPLCYSKCIHYDATIRLDSISYCGPILKSQFGAERTESNLSYKMTGGLFDFASAITVHKSQGSEFSAAVVVEECGWMPESDRRRWLYTAVTRAKSKLVIIGK